MVPNWQPFLHSSIPHWNGPKWAQHNQKGPSELFTALATIAMPTTQTTRTSTHYFLPLRRVQDLYTLCRSRLSDHKTNLCVLNYIPTGPLQRLSSHPIPSSRRTYTTLAFLGTCSLHLHLNPTPDQKPHKHPSNHTLKP